MNKMRANAKKAAKNVSYGFRNPKIWIDSGNYAMNYRMTRSFQHGYPLGKVTMLAGESGSGKSFLAASAIKEAQKKGNIYTIIFDSEQAMDEDWLTAVGVKVRKTVDELDEDEMKEYQKTGELPEDDYIQRYAVTMIDDLAKLINSFMNDYKEQVEGVPEEDRPYILFVVDSLGGLQTPAAVDQFQKGDMKGDFGHKPKQLKALIMNCVNMFGEYDVGMICTNHTYASQDMFDPDDKVAGGSGPVYAASIVLGLKKLKLKMNEDGEKVTDVKGIRSKAKVMKTRFSQPFKESEMKIFYESGLEKYSGLFELFQELNLITKPSGNKWFYTDKQGNEHKYFEKEYLRNENGILDLIMSEFDVVENIIENMEEEPDEEAMIDEFLKMHSEENQEEVIE